MFLNWASFASVEMSIPLKEGLRHQRKSKYVSFLLRRNVYSIKRRIATKLYGNDTVQVFSVEMSIPLKEGLRQIAANKHN